MLKLAILNFLGRTVYHEAEPPPRVREKPMEVLCVGFPRSATESLQVALLKLGYDYTYHGWDILFEEPHRMEAWARLCDKKFYGAEDGESNLAREDFDAIIGHSVAITDAPAALFAAEMIQAYPEAKVILNVRRDLEAWHRSADNALCKAVNDSWGVYVASWLTARGFWSWHLSQRLINPLLFRASDDGECAMARAIRRNGKWVYREHCYMIRGLVEPDRLLERDVGDGWEPLCKFLGKKVPAEEFPRTNNPAGFEKRVEQWFAANQAKALRNLGILGAIAVASAAFVTWRVAPDGVERWLTSARSMLTEAKS